MRSFVASCLLLVACAQLLAGCAHAVSSAPVDSVGQAVASLASGGIAVTDDFRTTTPQVALTGTPSAVRFTRFQVQNLVNEANAHAGYLGSELDGLATPPAGVPPLSTLITAWLVQKNGALAQYAAGLMGTIDTKHPAATVYPTIVVLTFIGDIARSTSTSQVPRPSFEPERLFAAPAEADGICTDISAWVSNQVNNITAAIQSNGSGWLSSLWNTVVSVGGAVVSAVFSTIANTVVGFITQIATICGVIMQVSSMFKPWSVQLAGTPPTIALTSSPAAGKFVATLTAADIPWPAQLISCVQALSNVTLTDASYTDAPITWTPKGNIPGLATELNADATLLANKTASYSYQTITVPDVPANECPRTVPAGSLVMAVSVARSDITRALTSLETLITNQISPVIRPYLTPYIQAALSSANKAAEDFAAPHQTTSVAVTEEVADPLCTPTPPPNSPDATPTAVHAGTGALSNQPCSSLLMPSDTAPYFSGGAVFIPKDENGKEIDVGKMMGGIISGTAFENTNPQALAGMRALPAGTDYDQKQSSWCVIGKQEPAAITAFFAVIPKGTAPYHRDQESGSAMASVHSCRSVIGQDLLNAVNADCRILGPSVTIYGTTAEYILTSSVPGDTGQNAEAFFAHLLQRMRN